MNKLRFVKAIDGLGQRVVVVVACAPDTLAPHHRIEGPCTASIAPPCNGPLAAVRDAFGAIARPVDHPDMINICAEGFVPR